jgi:hypothetical protein
MPTDLDALAAADTGSGVDDRASVLIARDRRTAQTDAEAALRAQLFVHGIWIVMLFEE